MTSMGKQTMEDFVKDCVTSVLPTVITDVVQSEVKEAVQQQVQAIAQAQANQLVAHSPEISEKQLAPLGRIEEMMLKMAAQQQEDFKAVKSDLADLKATVGALERWQQAFPSPNEVKAIQAAIQATTEEPASPPPKAAVTEAETQEGSTKKDAAKEIKEEPKPSPGEAVSKEPSAGSEKSPPNSPARRPLRVQTRQTARQRAVTSSPRASGNAPTLPGMGSSCSIEPLFEPESRVPGTPRFWLPSGEEHFSVPNAAVLSKNISMAIFTVLLILVLAIVIAFRAYPGMTCALIVVLVLWLMYFGGEEPLIQLIMNKANKGGRCNTKLMMLANAFRTVQGLRSSHEKEFAVQSLLHSMLLFLFFFNPDLPLAVILLRNVDSTTAVATLIILFVSTFYLVHTLLKVSWESAIGRRNPTMTFESLSPQGSGAVQTAIKEIQECMLRGRNPHAASNIRDVFAQMEGDMLAETIEKLGSSNECPLEKIFSFCQDTKESSSRKELVALLCEERVHDLSVKAKSCLLHAMMVLKLSSCSGAEAGAAALLLSTYGDALSELKCVQDGYGDVQSMHKLIFQDITDETLRSRVLKHFLAQGMKQVADRTLASCSHFQELARLAQQNHCVPEHLKFFEPVDFDTSVSSERQPNASSSAAGPEPAEEEDEEERPSWLKILTDMDDTMECSGGLWPAGIDRRYRRHTPYPGVTAFYKEIQGKGRRGGQIVALSARPHFVGEFTEKRVFQRFGVLMDHHGLHSMPALLTGSMDAGGRFLMSGGSEDGLAALAQKKFDSFEQYVALYPEYRIIFIGDNGQADYAVGQMMCQRYPHNVEQVWIHQVQEKEKTWHYNPDVNTLVTFFDDYVHAAVLATTRPRPLIEPAGVKRIIEAVVDDFRKMTTWPTQLARDTEAARLNDSIARAVGTLQFLGQDTSDIEFLEVEHPDSQTAEKGVRPDARSLRDIATSWADVFRRRNIPPDTSEEEAVDPSANEEVPSTGGKSGEPHPDGAAAARLVSPKLSPQPAPPDVPTKTSLSILSLARGFRSDNTSHVDKGQPLLPFQNRNRTESDVNSGTAPAVASSSGAAATEGEAQSDVAQASRPSTPEVGPRPAPDVPKVALSILSMARNLVVSDATFHVDKGPSPLPFQNRKSTESDINSGTAAAAAGSSGAAATEGEAQSDVAQASRPPTPEAGPKPAPDVPKTALSILSLARGLVVSDASASHVDNRGPEAERSAPHAAG